LTGESPQNIDIASRFSWNPGSTEGVIRRGLAGIVPSEFVNVTR